MNTRYTWKCRIFHCEDTASNQACQAWLGYNLHWKMHETVLLSYGIKAYNAVAAASEIIDHSLQTTGLNGFNLNV